MPLKVEPLEEPYLNMTPMVDVILNLLIFFMLGSRFAAEEQQVDIQLPKVSQAQPLTAPPDDIVINVFADGHVVVDQKSLTADELESLLAEARGRFIRIQAVLIPRRRKGRLSGGDGCAVDLSKGGNQQVFAGNAVENEVKRPRWSPCFTVPMPCRSLLFRSTE